MKPARNSVRVRIFPRRTKVGTGDVVAIFFLSFYRDVVIVTSAFDHHVYRQITKPFWDKSVRSYFTTRWKLHKRYDLPEDNIHGCEATTRNGT